MAVPKKKTSRQRRNKRRTHDRLAVPHLIACSHCKQLIKSHRICPNCGYYNGKETVIVEE